jgi:hypothetical protein
MHLVVSETVVPFESFSFARFQVLTWQGILRTWLSQMRCHVDMTLWNFGTYLLGYTASHNKKP